MEESSSDTRLSSELANAYKRSTGIDMDPWNPKNFTEKIQWLKINDVTPLKTELADKYLVRDWIKRKIGDKYLVPLLGVWNNANNIDFDKLPDKFVLKANHGSGMNIVIKDKKSLTPEKIRSLKRVMNIWLRRNFGAPGLEVQYIDIPRKIIAEKYIEQSDGNLVDYKMHCFNGVPKFIQVIGNRNLRSHTGYQINKDFNWNSLDWIFEDYPRYQTSPPKPDCLQELYDIAKDLSQGFAYVRVDMYDVDGKIYFGEMTFTPASGYYMEKGTWTDKVNLEIGKMITLP